MSTTIEIGMT